MTTGTSLTPARLSDGKAPRTAEEISPIDLRAGDEIAEKVNERNLEVLGKTVKVEELSYGRKGLYVFVNRRYRYDAGGLVYRVAK